MNGSIKNNSILSDPSMGDQSDHSKLSRKHSDNEHSLCPHKAVLHLPSIRTAEQARDQMKLICMQAQLGYMLLGVMGEKKIVEFGYPNRSVIEILQMVLTKTKTKVTFISYRLISHCSTFCFQLHLVQL